MVPSQQAPRAGPWCGPESWPSVGGSWRPEPSLLVVVVPAPGVLRELPGCYQAVSTQQQHQCWMAVGLARGSLTKMPCSACPLRKSAPRLGAWGPADSFLVVAVASLVLASALLNHILAGMNGGYLLLGS